MKKEERDRLGRDLAKLVQDTPPILKDDADILKYLAYVEVKLQFLREEADATLLQARLLVDPQFAAERDKKNAKFWKGVEHRRSLPKQGAAARRKQGAQTLSAVVRAWHSLSKLPKHNRAARIAQRCQISDRAVRIHLKNAGLT
jgi:hypothetical protein